MTKLTDDWKEFTKRAIELADLNQSELARLLTKKLGRNVTQGQIFSRIGNPNGRAPREEEDLKAWADCLKLDGQHRERFFRLAYTERVSPRLRIMMADMEATLEKTEKKAERFDKMVKEQKQLIEQLSAQLAEATAQTARLMKQLPTVR
jgi:hypothetical protein